MKKSIFICPICGNSLEIDEKTYICAAGHSFDKAREGYVHLLPPNKKHSKSPGDDKDMVRARNRFLGEGFYAPLRVALEQIFLENTGEAPVVLDSGCGEGYYTQGILSVLEAAGKSPEIAGIDISKEAVRLGAKGGRGVEFAVASAYHLPVAEGTIDMLLNCFSPLSQAEFLRVLRTGGRLVYVVPAPKHLWELKVAIYNEPYENQRISAEYEGFKLINTALVDEKIQIRNNQSLEDLFTMTPYFWKTPAEGVARLRALKSLETSAAFDIYVYEKL